MNLKRFILKFPILSLVSFLVLIDLFAVRKIYENFSLFTQTRFAINYPVSVLILSLALVVAWNLTAKFQKLRLPFVAITSLPILLQAGYYTTYKKLIPPIGVELFFSDTKMVTATSSDFFTPILLLITLVTFFVTYKLFNPPKAKKFPIIKCLFSAIISVGLFSFFLLHWYGVTNFNHSIVALYNTFTEVILTPTNNGYEVVKKVVKSSPTRQGKYSVIYVIGESTVSSHTSLYGYKRKTTPFLDSLKNNNELIYFTNALSIGNKTRLSVPYMMAGLEGPEPNGIIYSKPTLLNYAKKANYQTALVSAQDMRWGYLDKMFVDKSVDVFVNGTDLDGNVDVHTGADDILALEKAIIPNCKKDKPYFLVYQMNGSHYPYSKHSPDWIKEFLPEEEPNSVNAFDNSVLYTDYFFRKMHKAVHDSNTFIIFSTDHGQNLGGKDGQFNDNYKFDVINNAFFIIPPKGDTIFSKHLKTNSTKRVGQVDIVPTIADIFGYDSIDYTDGFSLAKDYNDSARIRVVSEYMPTFHNNAKGFIELPDSTTFNVNFRRKSLTNTATNKVITFEEAPKELQNFLHYRLNR